MWELLVEMLDIDGLKKVVRKLCACVILPPGSAIRSHVSGLADRPGKLFDDVPKVVRSPRSAPVILPAGLALTSGALRDLAIAPGEVATGELRLADQHLAQLAVLFSAFLMPGRLGSRDDGLGLVGVTDGTPDAKGIWPSTASIGGSGCWTA